MGIHAHQFGVQIYTIISSNFSANQHAGFPTEVLDAVEALTKRKGESRLDAARRAEKNSVALIFKLADITDNMDLSRISNPSEKDFTRLKEYEQKI